MTEQHGPDPSDVSALYVFAVCGGVDPAAVAGLPGMAPDAPVRTLSFGTLTAVVQTVRAADYTEEAWQARLADRPELERCARAHHEVVSAAAASCPTVPLPLATLYHSEERARQALMDETQRFRAVLRRTASHAEWGVKVYAAHAPRADAPRADAPQAGPGSTAGRTRPGPGAGLAYLDRKRGIQARREQRLEAALRIADTVDAEFQNLAAAARRLRVHGPELAGDRRVQVLNATYLVARERADSLMALTRTLRDTTGADIELSGPWVPYSFVGEV